MTEPNQVAEAVLIVIKRLFKWLGIGAAGLAALSAVVGGGWWAYDYITEDYPESKIEATALFDIEYCKDKTWPIKVTIKNSSSKTVAKFDFSLSATKPGYSKERTKYHSYNSDKIILPNQGWVSCWSAPMKNKNSKPEEHEWKIQYHSVTFAN